MRKSPQSVAVSASLNSADHLALRDVPGKGRGVFARRSFAPGELVLEFLGRIVDRAELDDLTHALQVGPTRFLTPSGELDDYVNHSCAPNTGIKDADGRVLLFALEPIAAGDEITFDYSTTQAGGYWSMDCCCGVPQCRGRIGDFKELPEDVRNRYLKAGAVLEFLK